MKFQPENLLITLFAFALLVSCDKIDSPVLESPGDAEPGSIESLNWDLFPELDPETYEFSEFPAMTGTEKDVLLEDYTGHKCNNCPTAAITAENIEDENPGRVHVVSIHASADGGFQQVDAEHPIDFTTEAGNIYATFPDPAIFGNPAGTVNRVDGSSFEGGIWHFFANWSGLTDTELADPTKANVAMDYYYSEVGNALLINAAIEREASFDPADYRFIIYLLRQEVIAPQTLPNGDLDEEYEHHNVLSDNINGTWGTPIALDELEEGAQRLLYYSFQLPDTALDATYALENLAIVGFVMDRTSQRVFQSTFIELE